MDRAWLARMWDISPGLVQQAAEWPLLSQLVCLHFLLPSCCFPAFCNFCSSSLSCPLPDFAFLCSLPCLSQKNELEAGSILVKKK